MCVPLYAFMVCVRISYAHICRVFIANCCCCCCSSCPRLFCMALTSCRCKISALQQQQQQSSIATEAAEAITTFMHAFIYLRKNGSGPAVPTLCTNKHTHIWVFIDTYAYIYLFVCPLFP